MAVMNALQKLEQFVLTETAVQRRVRISGTIREISPSYYRVAGLSQFVRLGDRVGFSAQDRTQIGEVVRIDDGGITVKPFNGRIDAAIGMPAFIVGDMDLSPDPSWKGRVINALSARRPVAISRK